MGVFSRSWDLTKVTLQVIKKDKELLAYPILSSVLSVAFILVLLLPMILVAIRSEAIGSEGLDVANFFMIFITYLGLALIFTFFSFCVVYTAKRRFEGGNATFFESVRFAFSRFHLVILWSLVVAVVGLLLRIIENAGRKGGKRGDIVGKIVSSLLGAAWNIATLFVMQAMVYDRVGPFKAMGKSVDTLKKTWGESIVRYIGFGMAEFIFILIGFVLGAGLIFLGMLGGITGILVALGVVIFYFVLVASFFSVANTVFNTALYSYAQTGRVPEGFTREHMQAAFTKKQ